MRIALYGSLRKKVAVARSKSILAYIRTSNEFPYNAMHREIREASETTLRSYISCILRRDGKPSCETSSSVSNFSKVERYLSDIDFTEPKKHLEESIDSAIPGVANTDCGADQNFDASTKSEAAEQLLFTLTRATDNPSVSAKLLKSCVRSSEAGLVSGILKVLNRNAMAIGKKFQPIDDESLRLQKLKTEEELIEKYLQGRVTADFCKKWGLRDCDLPPIPLTAPETKAGSSAPNQTNSPETGPRAKRKYTKRQKTK